MWKMSHAFKIPMDTVRNAHELFKAHATPKPPAARDSSQPTHEEDKGDGQEMILTTEAFTKVVTCLLNVKRLEDASEAIQYQKLAMQNKDINFERFCLWFSEHGFAEEMLLTKEQR